MTAFVGPLRLTKNVSFASGRRSPLTWTVTVLLVSPGAKVSVPGAARPRAGGRGTAPRPPVTSAGGLAGGRAWGRPPGPGRDRDPPPRRRAPGAAIGNIQGGLAAGAAQRLVPKDGGQVDRDRAAR